MVDQSNNILICQVSRRNMQLSFVWPNFREQITPGKWHYLKVATFLLGFGIMLLSAMAHLIVTIKDDVDLTVSEDVAFIASMCGIWYMATLYVRNQPNIAKLLEDLSQFNFGKPSNFEKLNKKQNFYSWFAFMYPTCGLSIHALTKLLQKSECEKINKEKSLNEKCGLVYSFWIPFEINYFPVFHLLLAYTWITAALFVSLHLSLFFQALEISQHIVLRIEHLNCLIGESFVENDFENNHQNLTHCLRYHQEILQMSERLDSCFTDLMFVHFVMTATICACLEKQLVDGIYPLTAVVHLFGWILSLFIASLGGQEIVDASSAITDAVWSSKWYLANIELQKSVLFLLAKSQRGLYMTVGSFGVLSYEFFLAVLKMSYSVLAMLTS